jgi:NADH-quinone oxidoreductase subunit J
MIEKVLFYAFAAILIVAALRVITSRNPVHSVLYLILAFFTASGLWVLLQAEFLAITLVLVYVGAVMVLFLFVIMMLDIEVATLKSEFVKYLPIGIVVGGTVIAEIGFIIYHSLFSNAQETIKALPSHAEGYSNVKELGKVIYTQHIFAFEIAAAVLLVAIVAAIALSMRHRKTVKRQDVSKQVKVRRQDRVRLLDLKEKG